MNSSIEESPVHELDTSRHISGENTTTSLSLHDLRVLCRSDTVSVDNLRETLSRLEHQVVDMSTYSIILSDICANASGTLDMVQCVMECIPGAASTRETTRGATPLHFVCMNKNATLDIFRCVYEGCQEAILVRDEFGAIPLFYLCNNDELDDAISVEILTWLLEKCPESVQCTLHGLLPIHLACKSRSPEFCCLLIEAYPDSLEHESDGEAVLIWILNSSKVHDSVALAILKLSLDKYPEIVRRVRSYGMSPLHLAAGGGFPRARAAEICRLLIQALPELLLERDSHGRIPLFFLCRNVELDDAISVEILTWLLEKCPESVQCTLDGLLPIHFACKSRSPEFCCLLIEAYPDSLEHESDGVAVLIWILNSSKVHDSVALAILKLSLDKYPEIVRRVRSYGMSPLHLAAGGGFPRARAAEICRLLIQALPELLLERDSHGRIPLFYLCRNVELDDAISVEILTWLLEKCPESVQCTLHGRLPIHLACTSRSPEFCCLLIEAYPDSIELERDGLAVLLWILNSSEVDDSVALAILKLSLDKYPEIVRRVRRWGMPTLHHQAAFNKMPRATKICRLLTGALPELVLEHDEDGFQPLHNACASGNLPVVKCILHLCPDAIRGTSVHATLFPIHSVVGYLMFCPEPEAAVKVTQYLLAVDPNVASPDVDGNPRFLPLFAACKATNESNLSAGLEVIKLLFDAYPEAIVNIEVMRLFADTQSGFVNAVQDFLNTQFHYAAQANDHQLVITPDEDGRLPLHNAILQSAPLGSIKLLVQADLSTLRIPDSNGSLPLHNECERNGRSNVCQYFLDHDRMSLLVADEQGDTPLHCACRGGNCDVIALLVEQYPSASVAMRNANQHQPIEVLLANNHEHMDQDNTGYDSSIFLLLRANPESWMNYTDTTLEMASLSISDI